MPEIIIEQDTLYIHLRGGDIFQKLPSKVYAQPPLCFYERIIDNSNFTNIYIISMDNLNIIVNILKQKYKNVIHKIKNIEYDISILARAYYLVLSVSSFAISAIKLNDNLKEIWEYDIMKLSQKLLFLHHHLYKFQIKYKIHTMKPSKKYNSEMFVWKRTPEQIKLMLEDDCPYNFAITKINI